ncbi:MAG: hypothetical protein ACFFDH_03570 [Promethearchaeota archaeon]
MNPVVYFSLIIMLFLRSIGLGNSLNFYYDLRKKSYFYLIVAWMLAISGNILPLIIDFILNTFLLELILVLNALLVSLSLILITIGIFLYFLEIKSLYVILSCIAIIFTAMLIFFFLDYNISISFSVIIMNSVIIIAFIIPVFKLNIVKKIMRNTIRWFYVGFVILFGFLPISLYIAVQGYGYGLYYTNDILIIILNYIIGIVNHFILIVLLIHLEYNISNSQQNQLKDKYSHNLGNIMQVIYSSADLFKRIIKGENIKNDNLDLIERKCKEASKLINEIRNL